jgi:hypothetical protein
MIRRGGAGSALALSHSFAPNILSRHRSFGRFNMSEPETPLPKAPILSYLSNVSTPTRVRNIAARSGFWIGVVHFAFFSILFVLAAWDIWTTARDYIRWHRAGWVMAAAPAVTLRDYYDALWVRGNYVYIIFLAITLAASLLLTVFSGPIRRGRKVPAVLALIYLVLFTSLIVFVAGVCISVVLVVGLGTAGKPQPVVLLWLLPAPVAILIILLLKDLCAFLFWIARNPTIEKPPTAFLPTTRHAPGGDHG